jgi:hypothetical protein
LPFLSSAWQSATADLVGMGEVSAEEIESAGEEDGHARALAAGAPASGELARAAFAALALLFGQGEADLEAARRVGGGSPRTRLPAGNREAGPLLRRCGMHSRAARARGALDRRGGRIGRKRNGGAGARLGPGRR